VTKKNICSVLSVGRKPNKKH